MECIHEFIFEFDKKEYYLYIKIEKEGINIAIETDKDNKEISYWEKYLDNKTIKEITSKMGSIKSLKDFSQILIEGLSKKNDNIYIKFCSLNEIRKLSANGMMTERAESNIKKYLVIIYINEEPVYYPIQMDYLGNKGTPYLLNYSIKRIKNSLINNESCKKLEGLLIIEKEKNKKLIKENEILNNKIKLLNEVRQLGAVENDDIYKNYSELQEIFENYKIETENKINELIKTIDGLKNNHIKEGSHMNQTEIGNNKIKEEKLNQENDISNINEYDNKIEKYLKDIENLKNKIKKYAENEKKMNVKIINLEKKLEKLKKEQKYFIYNNSTPKSSHSYKSNNSRLSYKNDNINNNKYQKNPYNKSQNYLKKNLLFNKIKHKINKYNNNKNNDFAKKINNSLGNRSKSSENMSFNSSKEKFKNNKNISLNRIFINNNKIKPIINNNINRNYSFKLPNISGKNIYNFNEIIKTNNVNNINIYNQINYNNKIHNLDFKRIKFYKSIKEKVLKSQNSPSITNIN